jgi:hypothetical protein
MKWLGGASAALGLAVMAWALWPASLLLLVGLLVWLKPSKR